MTRRRQILLLLLAATMLLMVSASLGEARNPPWGPDNYTMSSTIGDDDDDDPHVYNRGTSILLKIWISDFLLIIGI